MKKILCYIDNLGRGGAQRVMCNLINYNLEKGVEVVLVNDYVRDESLPHFDVPKCVKRVFLRKKRKGIPIIKNFERVLQLHKIIKVENPDLILSFLGSPNITTLLAGVFVSNPIVVSVRNDPNYEYGSNLLNKRLINILFKRANGVVFQTDAAAEYFSNKIKEKSTVILNPVDSHIYNDDIQLERQNIVTLGRLEHQKNHKLLIDAFEKISPKFDDNLYIYGTGNLKDEIQDYISKKGLDERVFLCGSVTNVKEVLCHSKLFVLSSDFEGLPNALMEAMATATPSISTDCPCGGPRSLIKNESQGILVPVNNPDALAIAMSKMLSDDDYRNKVGIESRLRASVFRDKIIYEQWEKFFVKIIKQHC